MLSPTTLSSASSEALLERARQSLAGGDSSTMRVLPYQLPLVARRSEGSRVWDAAGNEFLDMNMAYGPLLFGHRAGFVIESVTRQIADNGSQLGFPTEISMQAAEKIKRLFPAIELLRFANSGTEAIASAVRLARTVTGRSTVILFEGSYHGWSDAVFHRYHIEVENLAGKGYGLVLPGTKGMNGAPFDLVVCRGNDPETLQRCVEAYRDSLAAIICEPVQGNAGTIPPEPGFLHLLREITLDHDALLIFDEVITGMRVAAGGAQELYEVRPDITVVAKVLGGGYPCAAFGASRELMQPIVQGEMFHGGVYSGNAAVMAAANAMLDKILAERDTIYPYLYEITEYLAAGLREVFTRHGVPCVVQHVGPVLSPFLTDGRLERLVNYRQVRQHCQFAKYIELQRSLQRSGVFFHPNQFEPWFPSTAHTKADMDLLLNRMDDAVGASSNLERPETLE